MAKILATLAIVLYVGSTGTWAHPGTANDVNTETAATRETFMEKSLISYGHCEDMRESRSLQKRAAERRFELMARLSIDQNRFLEAKSSRDVATALNTNHLSNKSGLTSATKDELFTGSPVCVLVPEVTQGPYYIDGELIRADVRESQTGISLFVDIQVVDINTCKPIPNMYLDWWHCNSTGVYSGVVAGGNGNSNDASNLNATFLRGIAPTDAQGVVQFHSTFPGHYNGRAPHVHILTHLNGTVFPNGTYKGGAVQHVGQLFFDQDLISRVEATSPYNTNTQPLTTNVQDSILAQEAAGQHDPIVQYVMLGSKIEDGLLAWVTIGVDVKASQPSQNISPAATLTANGGVVNPNAGGGG
ncbi:hypothetical protein BV898_00367 [Hypsibius exemplaris]|uniref:Intradiol ring-cleavage dioxygenases domain-containing protein n=1 Tax=Hypsibius exemplaris TaxID=2072580 RepID=A0A1W0XFI8_HYPEX|nr:hypothetical protein BV898_00367 [Hypsibius exemplaris]